MIRFPGKHRFPTIFVGRLMDEEYRADERYVTQWLEMGYQEAFVDTERAIQETIIHYC
jgi:hypothetical protein